MGRSFRFSGILISRYDSVLVDFSWHFLVSFGFSLLWLYVCWVVLGLWYCCCLLAVILGLVLERLFCWCARDPFIFCIISQILMKSFFTDQKKTNGLIYIWPTIYTREINFFYNQVFRPAYAQLKYNELLLVYFLSLATN